MPLLAALAMWAAAAIAWAEDDRWNGVDRVVAVGDSHGAYDALVGVMQAAGALDEKLKWAGGESHFVSTGDLLDRGADSRRIMDLLIRLQQEASDSGGQVHVLLGNHEIMNLTGDLRYVLPAELAAYGDLDPAGEGDGRRGHAAAFSPTGRYGRWLLERPLAVVINHSLFLHGGVSEALLALSVEDINENAAIQLRDFIEAAAVLNRSGELPDGADFGTVISGAVALAEDEEQPEAVRAAAQQVTLTVRGLPFSPEGPVWYRGNAVCHPYYERQVVEKAKDRYDIERIVVGHTPTHDGRIHSRMDGAVIRIDTGMNVAAYKGNPSALVIERNGELRTVYTGLDATRPDRQPHRTWDRPYGMTDDEIVGFLKTADVIKTEPLHTGITKPLRLTLQQDDRTLRAVFKTFDSDPNLERRSWGRLADRADRYQYDVLAYRLDRMLGLELVPPAALRTIDGEEGVVQYWVENTINEKERREEDIPHGGECPMREQYNLMNVFDALIHNEDRNLSNVLYGREDWKLWLIDHSRAFRSDRRLLKLYKDADMRLSPQLRAALEGLTDERLESKFGPHLHPKQMDGLKARRDRLLRLR